MPSVPQTPDVGTDRAKPSGFAGSPASINRKSKALESVRVGGGVQGIEWVDASEELGPAEAGGAGGLRRRVGASVGGRRAGGIMATFDIVNEHSCMGSIGYSMGNGDPTDDIAHAVALDCSGAQCVYFDPLVGEFTFMSFDSFRRWWKACYDNRTDVHPKPGNAWLGITGFVRVDLYVGTT